MSLRVDITKRLAGFALEAGFEAEAGITVLFGPSGSGKTTLMRVLAGLERPDAGKITLGERVLFEAGRVHLPPEKREIGYVFQEPRLFPHMSVEKNLRYGAGGAGRTALNDEARGVVDMLGIGHLLERRPAKLSGGEQSRVALGRALLRRPKLLLADEPLAALDAARKAELLPYFERLRDELRIPVVYVTHSAAELGRLASRVVHFDAGQAREIMSGAEALADPRIMPGGVRGVGALIHARVAAHHDDGLSELEAGSARLYLPKVSAEVGQALKVRIAAQDVILARARPEGLSALNIIKGQVRAVSLREGPGAFVTLATDAGEIIARITRRSATALDLTEGAEAYAVIKTVSVAREDIGAERF